MKLLISILCLVTISLAGCRLSNPGGEIKDLPNFSRAESTLLSMNQCKGTISDSEEAEWMKTMFPQTTAGAKSIESEYINIRADNTEKLEVLRSALESSLSAVPVNLQQAFFSAGGKIVVDSNVNELCLGEYKKLKVHARTFVGEGELATDDLSVKSIVPGGVAANTTASARDVQVSGCWVMVADKFSSQGDVASWHPELLLNSTIVSDNGVARAPNVEHSTVRLFGYLLSQILAHLDANINEENRFDVSDIKAKTNDLFTAQVSKLLAALRTDIKDNPTRDFFYYQKHLAEMDAQPTKVGSKFSELEMAMHHYTFAEAFDSYYCSNATNLQMQNEFSNTYKIFFANNSEGKQIGLAAELDYIRVDEEDDLKGADARSGDEEFMFASVAGLSSLPFQYALRHQQNVAFFRIFRGIARGIGAVFRGIGRFMVGVYRTIIRPAVSFVVRVVAGVARVVYRAVSGIVRGALYVAGRVVGAVYSAFTPAYAQNMRSYSAAGPFRAGFTDAVRYWYRVR